MANTLHIDFETYSELDIKQTGVYRYVMHASTEVLMLAYGTPGAPVKLWVPAEGEPMPQELDDYFTDPDLEFHAFNAQFERLVLRHVLGYNIPIEQFRCSMVHAWMLGFSGGLAEVGAQMGVKEDRRKHARGKTLIQKFCKPAPRNHTAERYGPWNAPEDWAEFKAYCVQDVVAETEIEMLLSGYPIPQVERELYILDQMINDRGVPVDRELVDAAVELEAAEKLRLRHEMNSLTFLENANSPTQLAQWLSAQGLKLPNMQAETLRKAIEKTDNALVRDVLKMKLQVGKTSTTKWQAFQRATCDDGYLRGMFQFGGAQRTQRWAGRIVQLQNLKRPGKQYEKTIDTLVEALLPRNLDLAHALFDDLLTLLSESVRCGITAPDGELLTPCDLSSIESRILGHISGCEGINRVFREGRDTYRAFAMEWFRCLYEEVTKEQRGLSKPPTLGCGYQLGAKGLVEYADSMGVAMTLEEAKEAVDLYRELYPEVVGMWDWLINACKDVTENWTEHTGYCVRIRRDKNFLMIDLPVGRTIYYYQPLVLPMIPPWENDRILEALDEAIEGGLGIVEADELHQKLKSEARKIPTWTYMGMNQYSKQWERITSHGGKVTENIVQAVARDVLAFHMQLIDDVAPGAIRGHVHDEVIAQWRGDLAENALPWLEQTMSTTPPWMPGLLLGASGFVTKRYKKE